MFLRVSCLAIVLATVAPCSVAVTERTPVSEERVLAALGSVHLPGQRPQVQILSAVTTKAPAAVLQIAEIERWKDKDALVKFRCTKHECLPFYVALHWQTFEQREMALAASSAKRTVRSSERQEPLVRAGQQATLITTNNKFSARTPIICLQAGTQGQKVRVATMDHRRIALAEVVDSGILRGSF
jgi:hypothetical protein